MLSIMATTVLDLLARLASNQLLAWAPHPFRPHHPATMMSPTTAADAAAFAAPTGRVAAVSGANKGVGFFIGE